MRRSSAGLLSVGVWVLLAGVVFPAPQRPTPSAAADELIERERLRLAVEKAIQLYQKPETSGGIKNENFVVAVGDLVEAGPGVVPFLANELEQALPSTFFLCGYALGRLGTPEAEAALRRAIARADGDRGAFAVMRKGWAAWSLGLMGQADAIDLLNTGNHSAGHYTIHSGMSAVEAVAVLTYPDSVPKLLAQVDQLAADESMPRERTYVLRALWRVADPSALPKLKSVWKEKIPGDRLEALRAIGFIDTPEARKLTLAALDDEEPKLRWVAAAALERSAAKIDTDLILRKLETETDPGVLHPLYRILADHADPAMLPALEKHWQDKVDAHRIGIVEVLSRIGTEAMVPRIGRALSDPSHSATRQAATALGAIGGPEAVRLLLQALRSRSDPLVLTALDQLVALREAKAAPVIAELLLDQELAGVVRDGSRRHHIQKLAGALVALRFVERTDELRVAAARQVDSKLGAYLQEVIEQLEALQRNGKDRSRWIEAARSDRRHIRTLAYDRLAELGGEESARTLASAFGRVAIDEGVEILNALERVPSEPALALIERVLLDPGFDSITRSSLRNTAAWVARRIGGERMFRALEASARRREGRDAFVLVYLAVLGGDRALPVLESCRVPRMRYLLWGRGKEMETLDWIARRISAGLSLRPFDLPPDQLRLD